MLKPAQLYKEELEKLFLRTWYDLKYMFYSGWTGSELPTIPDNNYDAHHFASVDNNGNVIGYISYRISWITMSADNFGIISFGKEIIRSHMDDRNGDVTEKPSAAELIRAQGAAVKDGIRIGILEKNEGQ